MIYFIVLAIIWVVDTVLLATWNPFYFRYGIPVFRKTFSIPSDASASLNAKGFPGQTDAVEIVPSMMGKALSKHELALRESIDIEFLTYERFVHGYLVYNVETKHIELRLSANLFSAILSLSVIVFLTQAILKMFLKDALLACLILPFIFVLWAAVIWMLRRNISEFQVIVQDILEGYGNRNATGFSGKGDSGNS